jgi:hypothetical protein
LLVLLVLRGLLPALLLPRRLLVLVVRVAGLGCILLVLVMLLPLLLRGASVARAKVAWLCRRRQVHPL